MFYIVQKVLIWNLSDTIANIYMYAKKHVWKEVIYLRYLFLVVFHLFLLLSKFFVEFLSEFLEFDFPFLL